MAAKMILRQLLFAGLAISLALLNPQSLSAQGAGPNASDEAAVRAVLQQAVDAWAKGDGTAYAASFTEDADYVTFGGMLQKGRREIGAGHQQLFDTVLKGTRLEGQVRSVRFLSPGVALALTTHGILFPGQAEVAPDRKSVQTIVLVKRDGRWWITASQVTRVLPG